MLVGSGIATDRAAGLIDSDEECYDASSNQSPGHQSLDQIFQSRDQGAISPTEVNMDQGPDAAGITVTAVVIDIVAVAICAI